MKTPADHRYFRMYLLLLRCAAVLVPCEQRGEWRNEWSSELWYVWQASRRASGASLKSHAVVASFCRGAFVDGFWLRRSCPRPAMLNLTSPSRCILLLIGLLTGSLLLALHLPHARNAILPSPYRAAEHTLLIARDGYSDAPFPTVGLDEYESWRSGTQQFFTDLAFYQPVRERIAIADDNAPELRVARGSANLFKLLGSSDAPLAARIARWAGNGATAPSLVISESTWRAHFGADPAIVGRVIQVAGEEVTLAGIVPDGFWRLPGHMDAWIFYGDRRIQALPGDTRGFVVARLRPSAFTQETGAAWDMSVANPSAGYDRFECTSLASHIQQPFSMFLFALVLAVFSLPATTSLPLGEYPARRGARPRSVRLRRWIFLSIKLLLVVPTVYFVSLDLAQRSGNATSIYDPYLLVSIHFPVSFAGCLFALRWVLRDQRQRCPVCLRILKNPARVGQPSRTFLAWNGTELMCEAGHGLLHVPEIATSWFGTQRWLYLDPSWKSLFPDVVASV